jgi:hypothetical protein
MTPPKYEAKASMLLLPSATSGGGSEPTNPYLVLGGGLSMTANVLALEVTDTQVVQSLYGKGYRAAYTVALDATATAPILAVTATDSNSAMAASTLDAVKRTIGQRLYQDQITAKAPKNSYVTVNTLVQSPEPTAVVKDRIRTGIVGAVIGLLVALVPLIVVEARARRRARTQPLADERPVATLAALAPSAPVEEPERVAAQGRGGRPRPSGGRGGTGERRVTTLAALAPSAAGDETLREPAEAQGRSGRPRPSGGRSGTGERRPTTLTALAPSAPGDETSPESADARARSGRPRVSRARSGRPRAFGADG